MKWLLAIVVCFAFPACYEGKVDPPAADSTGETDSGEDDGETDSTGGSDTAGGDDEGGDDCDNAFSFSADIAPISEDKCDSCHPSLSPPDTTGLDGWQGDISNIIDRLEGRGSLMPQGGPALASDEIAGIKLWSECDFPE